MTDITNTHLEAALIDQKVAGAFRGKVYAFVAVPASDGYWQLGVAVSHERGYSPISGKTFTTNAEAKRWADGLNSHIGLNADRAPRSSFPAWCRDDQKNQTGDHY